MGLEVVVDEIKAKGDREAARIKSEADATAKTIVADATKRAEETRLAAETDAALQADRIMVREVASANLVIKRDQLNAQKELLDKVYCEAANQIANLSADMHTKAVRSLLKDAAKQIKEGIVYTNQRDEIAVKAVLAELKTLSGFTFGGITDIDGGVVVQSTDGQFTLDFSYQTFMSEIWEASLKDTSEILFGGNP
ncbi:MAG: V-type ATP synthase subunit E [Methanocalculaceae archaeon]|jgi:V/A-type H+-transporting ATPase subunit E|nr:V-type ATP synthase subunit E [Methanocalculaceae archaeon]